MGMKTVLVKDRLEWEKPYVDYFIPAVLKPLSEAGAKNVIKLDAAKQKELANTFKTLHRLSHPFYDPLSGLK